VAALVTAYDRAVVTVPIFSPVQFSLSYYYHHYCYTPFTWWSWLDELALPAHDMRS